MDNKRRLRISDACSLIAVQNKYFTGYRVGVKSECHLPMSFFIAQKMTYVYGIKEIGDAGSFFSNALEFRSIYTPSLLRCYVEIS